MVAESTVHRAAFRAVAPAVHRAPCIDQNFAVLVAPVPAVSRTKWLPPTCAEKFWSIVMLVVVAERERKKKLY